MPDTTSIPPVTPDVLTRHCPMFGDLLAAVGHSFYVFDMLPADADPLLASSVVQAARAATKALYAYTYGFAFLCAHTGERMTGTVDYCLDTLAAFDKRWTPAPIEDGDDYPYFEPSRVPELRWNLNLLRERIGLMRAWSGINLVDPEADGSYVVRIVDRRKSEQGDQSVWIRLPAFRSDGVRRQNVWRDNDRWNSYLGESVGRWLLSNGDTELYADVLKDPAVTILPAPVRELEDAELPF